jgi:hypothetical protein
MKDGRRWTVDRRRELGGDYTIGGFEEAEYVELVT